MYATSPVQSSLRKASLFDCKLEIQNIFSSHNHSIKGVMIEKRKISILRKVYFSLK